MSRNISDRLARCSALVVILALVVPGWAIAHPAKPACTVPAITIDGAQGVCGLHQASGNTHAFLGMPYAQATRWAHSTLVDPASGWGANPFKATQFGPVCPQNTVVKTNACGSGTVVEQAEDCLSINVWKPADAKADSELPVLLWIYGGGFLFGDSASALFDGAELAAEHGVVVVSFNYRLGALGFLANASGNDVDGHPANFGNFGFADQQRALDWVQRHIQKFGGDAGNVTIFGESAGAMSVGLHTISAPASQGRFQAAVMQSNPISLPYKNRELAGVLFDDLAAAKGIDCATSHGRKLDEQEKLRCLLAAETSAILAAQKTVSDAKAGIADFLVWAPIVDGHTIEREPIQGIYDNRVDNVPTPPMILGTNRNEGRIFADAIAAHIKKTEPFNPPFGYQVYRSTLTHLFPNHPDVAETLKSCDLDDKKAKQGCQKYQPTGLWRHVKENTDRFSRLLTDYLFTCGNRFFASNSTGPVYAYQFNQPPEAGFDLGLWALSPNCTSGDVCHGAELPYVFDSFEANWCKAADPANGGISNAMVGAWLEFAKSKEPGSVVARPGASAVPWPQYSPTDYMLFGPQGDLATGAAVTTDGSATVDCYFLDHLVAGLPYESYQLFDPTATFELNDDE